MPGSSRGIDEAPGASRVDSPGRATAVTAKVTIKRTFAVTGRHCPALQGWRQEGLLRLLENVLAVGEDPDNLVVYAALGRAARDWPSHDKIVETLKTMETGRHAAGAIGQADRRCCARMPRRRSSSWPIATWSANGRRPRNSTSCEKKGLICWGGLTAGDWQYIGSQGVIQGTYEIFMRIAERHFGGDLAGRFVLTAGLGGMGGAQPLAGTHGRRLRSCASRWTKRASTSAWRSAILDTQDAFARRRARA